MVFCLKVTGSPALEMAVLLNLSRMLGFPAEGGWPMARTILRFKKARQNGVKFSWIKNLAGRISTSVGSRYMNELARLPALASPQY